MYVRQTLMISLLSPVDLFSRNSPEARPDPTRREHHRRRRRFVLGPPFFQHRNSRLVEERTGREFWSSGPVASIHPSIPRGGGQPSRDRQRPDSWPPPPPEKKRGKSLSTCTPATSEQLQAGGSVESGAMRCSCRLAGWLHGKNGPEWRGKRRLSGTLVAFRLFRWS